MWLTLVVNETNMVCNKRGIMSHPPSDGPHVLRLDHYWPYQITVLADRIGRRTTRIVKERGLNLSQWRVLAAVAEMPGRTAVQVVRVTPMDKGIVSRATRGLLDQGLLRREASQTDGRLGHLFLTDEGQAARVVALSIVRAFESERERADLLSLPQLLPPDVVLVAGGGGAALLEAELIAAGFAVLPDLAAFRRLLRSTGRSES